MKPMRLFIIIFIIAVSVNYELFARSLIQNKGSDTLSVMAQAWSDAYKRVRPEVAVVVMGGGSGMGIAGLIQGAVDLANSSRFVLPKELEVASRKGVDLVKYTVGYDALAIYVHPSNPIESISLTQLAEIYGEGGQLGHWGALGVVVPGCQSDKMILLGLQNNSGSYYYFQNAVFARGRDFRLGTMDMHGSKEVVGLVAQTPCALGYASLAYATSEIKKVPVNINLNSVPVDVNVANVVNRTYPIWRPLFIYSQGSLSGEVKNYLDWIMSDAGQCILLKRGFAPIRDITCID